MPDQFAPQQVYEQYRYPSDIELINATNALLAGYDRYVRSSILASRRPASIVDWTKTIITLWEDPDE